MQWTKIPDILFVIFDYFLILFGYNRFILARTQISTNFYFFNYMLYFLKQLFKVVEIWPFKVSKLLLFLVIKYLSKLIWPFKVIFSPGIRAKLKKIFGQFFLKLWPYYIQNGHLCDITLFLDFNTQKWGFGGLYLKI